MASGIEQRIASGYYRSPDDTPEGVPYIGPGRGTSKDKRGRAECGAPCVDAANGRWESSRLTPSELAELEGSGGGAGPSRGTCRFCGNFFQTGG